MASRMVAPLPFLLLASAAAPAPSSFRDVALESRCDALRAYADDFATATFKPNNYRGGACAEGNGLGGAKYTLDFDVAEKHSFRIEINLDQGDKPALRLCDAAKPAQACKARDATEKNSDASKLLEQIAAWVQAKASQLTLYGEPYSQFLTRITKAPLVLPTGDGSRIQVQLRGKGSASFATMPPPAVMTCFHCKDLKCLNTGLHYSFKDRFFSLSRPKEKKEDEGQVGAGWVIEGPSPFTDDGKPAWQFACGVSRYSLQRL